MLTQSIDMLSIRIAPSEGCFILSVVGWDESVRIDEVARCQVYNMLEAREEWAVVHAEWQHAAVTADGWRLPCRVEIPFVHTVCTFDCVGRVDNVHQTLELSIPEESLVEVHPEYARLLRIDVLPEFTAAQVGERGYLLLPTLSGALHHFNHSVSREERITIYARQQQWAMHAHYNCVGMQREHLSWCAVVTGGDCDAEAVVRSHFDTQATYSVHIGLVYRWEQTDALLPGTRTVRYYLLPPADGGWAAFARCYRQFLREECGLRTWTEKAEDHPHVQSFAHGFLIKIMQGYKTASLDGRGTYQSATSFTEAQTILTRMQQDGITNLTVQMVGWNCEGHDGRYPTRFPVNPVEGGEEGFRALIAWGKQQGICISVHDNYSDSYQVGDDFTHDDGIVLRDGSYWCNVPWSGGLNWRLCPTQSIRYAYRDMPRIQALGIDGHYYIDAIGAMMPCHSPVHPANRAQTMDAFRELFRYTRSLFGTLSTEMSFAPYFDLIDGAYLDMSSQDLLQFSNFPTNFIDEQVPFLAIVMHNGIRYHGHNTCSTGRVSALQGLAWGAMPFIEVSARSVPGAHAMPTYDDLAEYAQTAYALSCQQFVDLVDHDLDDIELLAPDVYRSSFGNGDQLLVNATAQSVNIDGVIVPGLHAMRK